MKIIIHSGGRGKPAVVHAHKATKWEAFNRLEFTECGRMYTHYNPKQGNRHDVNCKDCLAAMAQKESK